MQCPGPELTKRANSTTWHSQTLQKAHTRSRTVRLRADLCISGDLILSHHPARAIGRRLPPSVECRATTVAGWPGPTPMTRPLCSSPITGPSTLLRSCPSLSGHRYFRPRGWRPCSFSQASPAGSTFHIKAWSGFAPPTRRMSFGPSQASPELIPEEGSPPVFTSPNPLSTLHRRFACARRSRPTCRDHCPDFSVALTTAAFDQSGPRWLGTST